MCSGVSTVFAQASGERLSLTLTPPLFQIGIARDTEWKSSLRLVNSNSYDIEVYARAVTFRPEGESGNASFSPFEHPEDGGPQLLANWVKLPKGPILVPRDSTKEIPFSILVPSDASPGGHYAAILVGTQPGADTRGPGLSVGSLITSLLFVRVPGEVNESARIRDFYAERSLVGSPQATFQLRFENDGNVHVIPQGQIEIFNMWGKKRGAVEINDQNTFGNVLPGTTRKFTFTWSGEDNLFEAGRYHAIATLVYGDDAKKTVYREAYFWVIPWKPVLGFLFTVIFIALFLTYIVKRYVQKVLEVERLRLGLSREEFAQFRNQIKLEGRREGVKLKSITAPIKQEIAAVRAETRVRRVSPIVIMKRYSLAIATVAVLLVIIVTIILYFVSVFKEERSYNIEVKREGGQIIVK